MRVSPVFVSKTLGRPADPTEKIFYLPLQRFKISGKSNVFFFYLRHRANRITQKTTSQHAPAVRRTLTEKPRFARDQIDEPEARFAPRHPATAGGAGLRLTTNRSLRLALG